MRTRTAGLLIAVVCLLGVAACGDDDTGPDSTSPGTDTVGESPSDGTGATDDSAVDIGDEPADATPLPTVPVDADRAAAATANARLLYSDVLPAGALAEEIDLLLATMCPIAADDSIDPADAAQSIVDLVPTDAGPPRTVPALIMIAGRYLVDDGCGTSPHIDAVGDELLEQLGIATATYK